MTAERYHATVVCTAVGVLLQGLRVLALSNPVCADIGMTWMTESPHLTGSFPFYSLIFFCEGDLNLEGFNVDVCTNYGKDCGQPAADAFCQYLGFEAGSPTLYTMVEADGPSWSMTGEWCVEAGDYQDLGYLNRTKFDSVNSTLSGPFCQRLDSVVCYDTRTRLSQNYNKLQAHASSPVSPPPPPPPPPTGEPPAVDSVSYSLAPAELPDGSSIGGRRRLLQSS